MNRIVGQRLALLILLVPFVLMPSACTIGPGDGYGYGYGYGAGTNIGMGIDYYEPFGFDYGGWGPRDRIGPPRGGARTFRHGGGAHSYRPAPPSHALPSLPSRPRGGGHGGAGRR